MIQFLSIRCGKFCNEMRSSNQIFRKEESIIEQRRKISTHDFWREQNENEVWKRRDPRSFQVKFHPLTLDPI